MARRQKSERGVRDCARASAAAPSLVTAWSRGAAESAPGSGRSGERTTAPPGAASSSRAASSRAQPGPHPARRPRHSVAA
eukprot:1123583-Alexandrium_andersonii.AAC.1